MRALNQADCLALWESGRTSPDRPGSARQSSRLSRTRGEERGRLAARAAAIARLRSLCCASFGATLPAGPSCRRCGEKLEFESTDGRCNGAGAPDSQRDRLSCGTALSSAHEPRSRLQIARFGLKTTRPRPRRDSESMPGRRGRLACLIGSGAPWVERRGARSDWRAVCPADPLAEIMLDFTCPGVPESFEETLDLPAFLWSSWRAARGGCSRCAFSRHGLWLERVGDSGAEPAAPQLCISRMVQAWKRLSRTALPARRSRGSSHSIRRWVRSNATVAPRGGPRLSIQEESQRVAAPPQADLDSPEVLSRMMANSFRPRNGSFSSASARRRTHAGARGCTLKGCTRARPPPATSARDSMTNGGFA